MAASRGQVEIFLTTFHNCWPPQYIVINRENNRQALADLGLMPRHREEIICNLTVDHYSDGPLPDDSPAKDDVWIFGCEVDSIEIYIKLLLKLMGSSFTAKCLSFHPAEFPLAYPFRE